MGMEQERCEGDIRREGEIWGGMYDTEYDAQRAVYVTATICMAGCRVSRF